MCTEYLVKSRKATNLIGLTTYNFTINIGKYVISIWEMNTKGVTLLYYYREVGQIYETHIEENLAVLSEEEVFQKSLVWEKDLDIFLLKGIQDYFSNNDLMYPEDSWYQTFGV